MKHISMVVAYWVMVLPIFAQTYFADRSEAIGFTATGKNISINIVDYNNDGLEDIYVGRIEQTNHLYHNNGDGTYTELANELGIAGNEKTYTSVWGDMDNDGDQDLYVGNRDEANRYYQNNGDGSFTERTNTSGLGDTGAARSLLLADIDQDGWLDIYVANLAGENALFHNEGDGTFTNIVVTAGATDNQLSLGAIFFDYDNDGDQDLYLTHDNNQANILYRNNGDNQFTDVSEQSGANYAGFGMGVDVGDMDNDGWLDIYITNLYDNILLRNQGDGTFEDITSTANINDYGMGWGTTFFDFDNDGWLDIYVVNDSYFSDYSNILYRNLGNNTYEQVTAEEAISSRYGGYATASFDFNSDGRLDLVATNIGEQGGNQYFENVTDNAGHWLQVKLIGTTSNRDAIGARISVYTASQQLIEEIAGGSGYASQNSLRQHFGLGAADNIDSLLILWPNGTAETYYDLAVDQALTFVENEGITNVNNVSLYKPELELAPNPVTDHFSWLVNSEQFLGGNAQVVNAFGEVVLSLGLWEKGQRYTQDIHRFPNGFYWLQIHANGQWYSYPLMKQ